MSWREEDYLGTEYHVESGVNGSRIIKTFTSPTRALSYYQLRLRLKANPRFVSPAELEKIRQTVHPPARIKRSRKFDARNWVPRKILFFRTLVVLRAVDVWKAVTCKQVMDRALELQPEIPLRVEHVRFYVHHAEVAGLLRVSSNPPDQSHYYSLTSLGVEALAAVLGVPASSLVSRVGLENITGQPVIGQNSVP